MRSRLANVDRRDIYLNMCGIASSLNLVIDAPTIKDKVDPEEYDNIFLFVNIYKGRDWFEITIDFDKEEWAVTANLGQYEIGSRHSLNNLDKFKSILPVLFV